MSKAAKYVRRFEYLVRYGLALVIGSHLSLGGVPPRDNAHSVMDRVIAVRSALAERQSKPTPIVSPWDAAATLNQEMAQWGNWNNWNNWNNWRNWGNWNNWNNWRNY